jgi:hypothetical protein
MIDSSLESPQCIARSFSGRVCVCVPLSGRVARGTCESHGGWRTWSAGNVVALFIERSGPRRVPTPQQRVQELHGSCVLCEMAFVLGVRCVRAPLGRGVARGTFEAMKRFRFRWRGSRWCANQQEMCAGHWLPTDPLGPGAKRCAC